MFTTVGKCLIAASLTVALAFAQGQNGKLGSSNAPKTGAGLNMTAQQTIEGAITSVQIAYAAQYPSIVVNGKQIKVAPAWYLLNYDFSLAAGETVRVLAAPSNLSGDPYLYAIEITKVTGGASITLRDGSGLPLWTGSNGQGARAFRGSALGITDIQTVSGVIDHVTAGLGIQHPTLTLNVAGTLVTVELGPEWVLAESDIELIPGSTATVKYGVAVCDGDNVALAITDASGTTLVLRTDDGLPAWNK